MYNFEPFDPSDDTQLFDLMKEGEYDFLVKDAKAHINQKNGNQSIKLSVQVYNADGSSRIIDCYLSVNYKKLFAHFFSAVGLEDACKSGAITPEICINKSGRCLIGVDAQEGSKFDPKNVILDFVKASPSQQRSQEIDPNFDDNIPF